MTLHLQCSAKYNSCGEDECLSIQGVMCVIPRLLVVAVYNGEDFGICGVNYMKYASGEKVVETAVS
jgi:hypothetical protein